MRYRETIPCLTNAMWRQCGGRRIFGDVHAAAELPLDTMRRARPRAVLELALALHSRSSRAHQMRATMPPMYTTAIVANVPATTTTGDRSHASRSICTASDGLDGMRDDFFGADFVAVFFGVLPWAFFVAASPWFPGGGCHMIVTTLLILEPLVLLSMTCLSFCRSRGNCRCMRNSAHPLLYMVFSLYE